MELSLSEASENPELESLMQARAYAQLKDLGLFNPPEKILKALLRHPDALTPPVLMRWTSESLGQDAHMISLNAQELALWGRNWDMLHQASELPSEKCQALAEAQIPTIELLLERHSDNPVLKNQLCQAYKLSKNWPTYYAEAEKMLQEHPDYLFARLTVAEIAQSQGHIERFPEIFAGKYEIQEHSQERIYHVSEIASLYGLLCPWHLQEGHLLRAAWAFALVRHADPEHPVLPELIQLWLGISASQGTELKQYLSPPSKLKRRSSGVRFSRRGGS